MRKKGSTASEVTVNFDANSYKYYRNYTDEVEYKHFRIAGQQITLLELITQEEYNLLPNGGGFRSIKELGGALYNKVIFLYLESYSNDDIWTAEIFPIIPNFLSEQENIVHLHQEFRYGLMYLGFNPKYGLLKKRLIPLRMFFVYQENMQILLMTVAWGQVSAGRKVRYIKQLTLPRLFRRWEPVFI